MRETDRDKKKRLSKRLIPLGILIDRKHSVWQVGRRSHFLYREMTRVGKKHHILVFFFFAKDVDWKQRQVQGYIWEKERWHRRSFPLPAVIYSRIVERSWENRPVNQAFLHQVQEDTAVSLFNSRFLNKLEVEQALYAYAELRPYLPQTDAGSEANLKNLLAHYPEVYVKPIHGCKGQGIVHIQKTSEGIWQVKPAALASSGILFDGIDDIFKQLRAWQIDLEQCVVQQAVPRAVYRGRVLDIRALAQKDGQGKWTYVGAAVRLAAKGKEVTHVVNGGKRASFDEILREIPELQRQQEKIVRALQWLCQVIPLALEKQIPLHWGLFAFDMALTPEGKLYLLEVNSRPGSYSENQIRYRSLTYLMAYCRYVAEGGRKA